MYIWSGDVCVIYILMTNFSLVVFYIFISTSNLYVQQCGQLTGAALCDVYKCNAKSNVMLIRNVHVLI